MFRTEEPLEPEFLKKDLAPLIESIRTRLIDFSEKLLSVSSGGYDVMCIFGDWEDDNGKILSVFDAFGSEDKLFVIRFHAGRLLQLQAENPHSFERALDQCVLHELVHALDMSVIRESCGIYHSRDSLVNAGGGEPGLFWSVMHYFSFLRNEGVAMMAERLFLENGCNPTSSDLFIRDLDLLFCHLEEQLEQDRGAFSHDSLQSLCSSVYSYADGVMMELLGVQNKELPESEDKREELLKEAMQMDLSEWVILIFSRYQKVFSKYEKALSIIMSDQEEYSRVLLLSNQYYFNIPELIRFCSGYCERQLSIEELTEYVSRDYNSMYDVHHSLHLKARELMALRTDTNAELIDWVLSYFYQQSDGIADERPFVGFMDDWFVMDMAFHRVGLQQFSIGLTNE